MNYKEFCVQADNYEEALRKWRKGETVAKEEKSKKEGFDVKVEGNKVMASVGAVEHPMLDVHYIMFIAIETTHGKQVKYLKPGEAPYAEFLLAEGEELVKAYEYCNLHSLWSN